MSFEFRFECAKLLLELDESTDAAMDVLEELWRNATTSRTCGTSSRSPPRVLRVRPSSGGCWTGRSRSTREAARAMGAGGGRGDWRC